MSRAIVFVSCLCCALLLACSNGESSMTDELVEVEIPIATETPIEEPEEKSSDETDRSPTTSSNNVESSIEDMPEPSGIVRSASEVIDATGLGGGILQPLGAAPLPEGFSEVELLISGEATSYKPVRELTTDGEWFVKEDNLADYKIRVLVRFPSAESFSGVVVAEWMNVTAGVDNTNTWAFISEEMGREGHAFIGVSAQLVGIMGRDTGRIPSGLLDTRGLPTRDPDRYGDLTHPGDAFSFDIFTQSTLGALQWLSDQYGFEHDRLIATGQSQSAGFLTSYINAVDPIVGVLTGTLFMAEPIVLLTHRWKNANANTDQG